MRKLLVTIATPAIAELADGFIQVQRQYAAAQGFDYLVREEIYWKDLHPSFSKVREIAEALVANYDYVIWADADVLFTNHQVDLLKLVQDDIFIAGYQQNNWTAWKYICAGLLVVRNCHESRHFLYEWMDRCENGTSTIHPGRRTRVLHHPWEQWYFDELIRETEYRGIYAAPAREIGCFCKEIWSDGIDWLPGMPTLHMAGPASWEQRAAVLPHYLPQIIR